MIWWVLGFVCLGLLVLAGIAIVLLERAARRRREQVLTEGVAAVGWLVQANSVLFEPGTISAPAQILLCFDGEAASVLEELSEIAARLGRLKSSPPTNAVEKRVTNLVTNETYRPTDRHTLPIEFTGGLKVQSAHVWIDRSLLPEGRITRPYIHCRAVPGDEGMVYMVPYPNDEHAE